MIAKLKQWLAARRLQRLIDERRSSYAVQDYARRRKAALKHTRRAAA